MKLPNSRRKPKRSIRFNPNLGSEHLHLYSEADEDTSDEEEENSKDDDSLDYDGWGHGYDDYEATDDVQPIQYEEESYSSKASDNYTSADFLQEPHNAFSWSKNKHAVLGEKDQV